MSSNVTATLLQMFNKSLYFSSLEEFSYFLGLFGLLLAIIQFGLPYSQTFVARFLSFMSKGQRSDMANRINKILGFTAFGSLIAFPILFALFLGKLVNTIAILLGFGIFNSVWVLVISTVFFAALFAFMGWRWLKRYILSDTFELPQTDMQMLKGEITNLSKGMKELSQTVHELSETVKRGRR